MKKYKRGYTAGVYDMFHIGHLNILKNAKNQCDFLIIAVTTDELCYQRKNKYPIIPFKERFEILKSIKYVDYVVSQKDMDKISAIKKFNCDVVFVGSDWKNSESWNELEKQLKKINVDVVYLQHTDGISSTILRNKITQKGKN